MKKLTLIFLIAFLSITGTIYVFSAFQPSPLPQKPVSQTTSTTPSKTEPTSTNSTKPALTIEEIAKHNQPENCYLLIKNKVYNVSSYLDSHPGGLRSITSRCGEESTGIFAQIHSNFAWDLLADYYIGDLTTSAQTTATTSNSPENFANIEQSLKNAFPKAEIISIKPKKDSFVAKIINEKKLVEIHLDNKGNITSQETEDDEYDWGNWENDQDDD